MSPERESFSKRGTGGDGSTVRGLKRLILHATHSRQGFDGTVSKRERQNVLYIVDFIAAVNNLTNTVVSARHQILPGSDVFVSC